jgi:hypothetical protein
LLSELGVELEKLRLAIADSANTSEPHSRNYSISVRGARTPIHDTVAIHGSAWDAGYVRDALDKCREYSWHWRQCSWHPRDIVIDLKSGASCFELHLAEDTSKFRMVKDGWKKDHCTVCRWELFESKEDPEHGSGYTNGRDWLCSECYEKFWQHPNYFSASHPEIT